jgi:hypothetical protein
MVSGASVQQLSVFLQNDIQEFILLVLKTTPLRRVIFEKLTVAHVNIMIPDIIRGFVFYLKHNVWENGFCLRLQVVPTVNGDKD